MPLFTDEISFAGDFFMPEINLLGQADPLNLRSVFLELNIYESITKPAMYGNVTIADTGNIKMNMPLTGQEEIEFKLELPDNESIDFFKHRGRVYKVDNQIKTNERQQVYTLHFTTREGIRNEQTRVESAFEGTASDILSKCTKDFTNKPIFVSQYTNYYNKLLGNRMKMFSFIKMLARRNNAQFYENHRGFQFKPLHKHYENEDSIEYFDQTQNPGGKDVASDMHSITEYRVEKQGDILGAIASGQIANTQYNYQRNNKRFTKTQHNYDLNFRVRDVLDNHAEKTPFPIYNDIREPGDKQNRTLFDMFNSVITVETQDDTLHTQSATDTNNYENKTELKQVRLQDKASMNDIVVKCTVPGNTNLAAGDMVTLNLPSFESLNVENKRVHDIFLSGRYLIRDLVHTVSPQKYTTTFTCVKSDYRSNTRLRGERIEDNETNARGVIEI